jgi:LacI family transcriptional regulator
MYEREVMVAQALIDHRVDGVLVSLAKSTRKFDHLMSFPDNNIPLIFFDRECSQFEADAVVVDDFKGAYLATEHLISVGCKNIVHLSAPDNLLIGRLRKEGYMQALLDNNQPVDPSNIYLCDTPEKVIDKIHKIFSRDVKPDGFFAVNDSTAIKVIQELASMGYKVPRDIAVAGFGDGPQASIICPTLTTVEQNGYEMGFEATRFLLERIAQGNVELAPRRKVFEPVLIKRDSTNRSV